MTEKNACNHEKKVNDIRTKMLMSHYNSIGYSVPRYMDGMVYQKK